MPQLLGRSNGNANPDITYYDGSRAMVVPRTNGFLAKNIRIYNYGSNSALIESCSVCWNVKLWVQGGKNTQFINVNAFNSDSANRIFWQKHRREIFWDQDGSISKVAGGAYIIPYKKHIDGISRMCYSPRRFLGQTQSFVQ
ncbi:unnamed protein product (macronuclear) [Paramecium tetraurelia]|uniref:Pectate lyase n=1 Tax=Paramecium tetraurelia TaxID=5888 RepID=A0D606_PARTE|nr:uncharacterized protein GSPATT00013903001 [Paramecium tetraurelia]CAK78473.1 unnamed protein product [Paramecium tetraurelia]|eukprot:XP_001445870.1 hypothetical protein (macronuclear) [Paramecium tetraurelia strain d4-2]